MAARGATWFAIIVGGTGGTLAALSGSNGAPAPIPAHAPSAALPMRPLGQLTAPSASLASAVPSGPPASSASAASTVSSAVAADSASSANAAPSATAPLSASASKAPAAPLPAAERLPLPTTKQALLKNEMRCDQRKAESCIVAARSYEGGSAGVTDAEKAAKYRRIALTAWISQCDHNSVAACATLASMYRAGSGVPQSDRNADALVERARDLCRFNAAPACQELPPR